MSVLDCELVHEGQAAVCVYVDDRLDVLDRAEAGPLLRALSLAAFAPAPLASVDRRPVVGIHALGHLVGVIFVDAPHPIIVCLQHAPVPEVGGHDLPLAVVAVDDLLRLRELSDAGVRVLAYTLSALGTPAN